MINPVWWHYKLSNAICLEKQNRFFFFSQTEDALCKNESKWICSNVPDANFNAHASHNMNLRKQMAFRPFLQNVSQMHWRNERKRNKVWVCVCRLFWKRKPEFLFQSLVTPGCWLLSFQRTCILMRLFKGENCQEIKKIIKKSLF